MPDALWPSLTVHLALLAVVLPVAWRWPVPTLAAMLITLAVRFEILLGGPEVGYSWTIQHTVLAAALAGMAIRNGVRPTVNWPVLALALMLGLNVLFSDLHPRLTLPFMIGCFAVLALPFCFTQVTISPGSRTFLALSIASIPAVSFTLGVVLDLVGWREQDHLWALLGGVLEPLGLSDGNLRRRLQGATGNAGTFAILAFGGLVAAAGEWLRTGQRRFAALLLIDGILVVLSGTRMAIVAGTVFAVVLVVGSPAVRERLRASRATVVGLVLGLGAVLLLYLPQLLGRSFAADDGELKLSSRDEIWSFYLEEFWLSPLFGRGIGAGFIAIDDWSNVVLTTPHNDYLNLLVSGGIIGFALVGVAVALWLRALYRDLSPPDRPLLIAAASGIGSFALAWDLLVVGTGLAVFAYVAALLIRPIKVVRRRRDQAPSPATEPAQGAVATPGFTRSPPPAAMPAPDAPVVRESPGAGRPRHGGGRRSSRARGRAGARS